MPQIPTGRHLFFFPFSTILDGWSLALPYRIMEGLPVTRDQSEVDSDAIDHGPLPRTGLPKN
jgi:hypothetical protein